jgi:hypothetical protein
MVTGPRIPLILKTNWRQKGYGFFAYNIGLFALDCLLQYNGEK